MTSQTSIAARRGTIHWDDLNGSAPTTAMRSYQQSKIACGLFGLELSRRSRAGGWGITSTISHPGVAPTSLLAARPELGRTEDTAEVRVIRWLSARGLIVGTVETAKLPALMAATSPAASDGGFYGPQGRATSAALRERRSCGDRCAAPTTPPGCGPCREELTAVSFP